jgi:uncharacterized protein (TIGR00369 family)
MPQKDPGSDIHFIEHIGARIEESGHGGAVIVLDLKPHLRNRLGVAHGGVVMTMLDVAMARAARSTARQEGDEDHGVVTIEMKSTFVQAATGDRLVARGHTVHRSASLCFAEAEVHDESGRLIARSSGTFKYVKPKLIPHRPPK